MFLTQIKPLKRSNSAHIKRISIDTSSHNITFNNAAITTESNFGAKKSYSRNNIREKFKRMSKSTGIKY